MLVLLDQPGRSKVIVNAAVIDYDYAKKSALITPSNLAEPKFSVKMSCNDYENSIKVLLKNKYIDWTDHETELVSSDED